MSDNKSLTVAIVDDDQAVRESLLALLESFAVEARGYPSAEAYLDALGRQNVCCLILDLNMPGMGGFQLLEILRSRSIHTPVIVLTGRTDEHLDAKCRRAGADRFLRKPADGAMLVACLHQLIRPSDLPEDGQPSAWLPPRKSGLLQ